MKKILVTLLILTIAISIYLYIQKPNKEIISISDEIYLVIEDNIIIEDNPVIIEDDMIYISFDIIKEYLDPDLFYDLNEETIIFTDKEKVRRFKIGHKKATVNYKEFNINNPIKKIGEKVYIPKEVLINNYDININYIEETKAIVLDKNHLNYVQGEVIMEGADIRINFDKKSPIVLKDVPVETPVIVFEELDNWYKVRTYHGIIGYIEKKYLKINLTNDVYKVELESREKEDRNGEKINMTWDYTNRKVVSIDNIDYIYGINIVSPTWFSISDNMGNILDKGNFEYVEKYSTLGYKVWPLIDNGFDPDLTYELLSSSKSREQVIEKIVQIYDEYKVDGINIDFENVYLKDKDLLTQFVRELYPIFREKGMMVSIDVTPISISENWSLSLDRKRLSQAVDYVMLMAYDQHWASSTVAGSVSQYSWVEESLLKILQEVPNHKLILGVPFYTRLWKLEKSNGGEQVSSQALSMEGANNFIKENNVELEWDEESGQYHGETVKEGITYKIWVEDAKSLKLKSSLVNKYDLAGIASWRKGFETEEVWPAISNMIKLN